MICPIMSKAAGTPPVKIECSENCAWYIADCESCAMAALAESITDLSDFKHPADVIIGELEATVGGLEVVTELLDTVASSLIEIDGTMGYLIKVIAAK